jgi:glycosyltransferase involved in cell wall biosynthesis
MRELIRDGLNGFLADPRDVRGYAARAAALLAAHGALTRVRRAARRTITLHLGREAALTRQRAVLALAAGLAAA